MERADSRSELASVRLSWRFVLLVVIKAILVGATQWAIGSLLGFEALSKHPALVLRTGTMMVSMVDGLLARFARDQGL
jgi:hypothetical protein